eukprot:RCo036865
MTESQRRAPRCPPPTIPHRPRPLRTSERSKQSWEGPTDTTNPRPLFHNPLKPLPSLNHVPARNTAPLLNHPLRQRKSQRSGEEGRRWRLRISPRLDQVRHVHRHLIDLSAVVLLNVTEDADVVALHEVDSHPLAAVPPRPPNAVDVELPGIREVVVDHQTNLGHVQPTGPHIGNNKNSAVALAEVPHHGVSLLLLHPAVHAGDGEVGLAHLLGQPLHLLLGIAEDHGLGDRQRVVQVAEGVKLPILPLHSHEELLDTLQGELITLDQDPHWVRHKLSGHLQHIMRESRRHQHHLGGRGEVAINVVDLLLEAPPQHLVGLIQHQGLDVAGAQIAAADHVKNSPRGPRHHLSPRVELPDVIRNGLAPDAAVAGDAHVLAQAQGDLLGLHGKLSGWGQHQRLGLVQVGLNGVEDANAEHRGLARAGLCLRDQVPALDHGDDRSLLDR